MTCPTCGRLFYRMPQDADWGRAPGWHFWGLYVGQDNVLYRRFQNRPQSDGTALSGWDRVPEADREEALRTVERDAAVSAVMES